MNSSTKLEFKFTKSRRSSHKNGPKSMLGGPPLRDRFLISQFTNLG